MADTTISVLTQALAAKMQGTAVIPLDDTDAVTKKSSLATLRTVMFAGSTGYTATDPLVCGTIAASGIVTLDKAIHMNAVAAGPSTSATMGGFAYRTTGEGVADPAWVFRGNGYLFESTAPDWWMIINDSGNVGIGIHSADTSADALDLLHLRGGSLRMDNDITAADYVTLTYTTPYLVSTKGITASGSCLFGAGTWPTTTIGRSGSRAGFVSATEDGYLLVANMNTASTGAVGLNYGGAIYLGARGTDNTANMAIAEIFGARESATSANLTTYLSFKTSNAAGARTEYLRISSAGAVTMAGTLNVTTSIAVNSKVFTFGANDSGGAGYRTVTIQNA